MVAVSKLLASVVAGWGLTSSIALKRDLELPLDTKLPEAVVSAHQATGAQTAAHQKAAEKMKRLSDFEAIKSKIVAHRQTVAGDLVAQAAQQKATLEQQAEGQRTLAKVRELNRASNMLGVLTFSESKAMMEALVDALADTNFTTSLQQFSKELQASAAMYSQGAKKRLENVVVHAHTSSDAQLVNILGEFFSEEARLLAAHRRDAEKSGKKIQMAMPVRLNASMAPLTEFFGSFSNVSTDFDKTTLIDVLPTDACKQVSVIMTNVSFYDNNLRTIKQTLNATAKIAPLIVANTTQKKMSADVVQHVQQLVHLGFMESIVLEDISGGIRSKLGPIIADRLNCTWSGALRNRGYMLGLYLIAAWAATSLFGA